MSLDVSVEPDAGRSAAPPSRSGARPRFGRRLAAVTTGFVLTAAVIGGLCEQALRRAAPAAVAASVSATTASGGAAEAGGPASAAAPALARPRASAPTARIDRRWAEVVAARTGIPARAIVAYASAALTLAEERPGCGLGWNTVAGIGQVESSHGAVGGGLLDSGRTAVPIRGVTLDGAQSGTVRDTDDGGLDGDDRWDRAVGPLQFLPSTWRRWGADGNADGVADPDQLDDAALTAARYLCAAGDLGSARGWRTAVYAYNHSDSYVDQVAQAANRYAHLAGP